MSHSPAVYIEVRFSSRAQKPVMPEQLGGSYCASGYIFLGELTLFLGNSSLSLPVQSGGWMNADSPFKRAGLCPADASWGAYVPELYPDTAFPALPGPTSLGTLRTGKRRGFRVPDPPGTGRSALMVHDSERYGSEGCISTPAGEPWERFCAYMNELYQSGIESIPLRVLYDCPPPEPQRCSHPLG